MDWELACHELLICQHQWFDLFRSLDPLAKPFFPLRKRFPRAKFSNNRLLKRHVPANIFKVLPHSWRWSRFYSFFLPFWSWNYSTFKDLRQRENYISSNRKLTKLKTSYTCSAWLTRMSELSRFVYIINHVTLHVKSNAEKVNRTQLNKSNPTQSTRFCDCVRWLKSLQQR